MASWFNAFANLTVYGFTLTWTAPSSGATSWLGTYETVGN